MKLLLHACCGPCSLEPVRLLQAAGHDIAIYYANSNIAPREEYAHRLATLENWAKNEGIPVIEGPYDPATWEEAAGRIGDAALADVRSARKEAQSATGEDTSLRADVLSVDPARREARCRACYRLRLEETARVAAEQGFDGIGTTLSVSPYQYTQVIEQEVRRAAEREGIEGVFEDFRPYYEEATAERAERKAQRAAAKQAERAEHAAEIAAAEAELKKHRAERAAYDKKQARKRAILKSLREQAKQKASE